MIPKNEVEIKRMLISSIDQNIKCVASRKSYVLDIRLCRPFNISFTKEDCKNFTHEIDDKADFQRNNSFCLCSAFVWNRTLLWHRKEQGFFNKTKYQAEPPGNSFPSVCFKGRQLQYFILSLTSYVKRGLKNAPTTSSILFEYDNEWSEMLRSLCS